MVLGLRTSVAMQLPHLHFGFESLFRVIAIALFVSVFASLAFASGAPWMQTKNLDGTWQVTQLPLEAEGVTGLESLKAAGLKTIDAQVPGEIHLDLMRAGEMEDPSVSSI